jgi:RNA polymerase sigma factor (TIGR02999 family)
MDPRSVLGDGPLASDPMTVHDSPPKSVEFRLQGPPHPMIDPAGQITVLLRKIRSGDREAESVLLPLVYEQLRRVAVRQLKSERSGHSLQSTDLIHEAYLRIIRNPALDWQSRAHLFAVAAQTMRRILVDHARAANAQRRPHRKHRVDLDAAVVYTDDRVHEMLMIDEVLNQLAKWDPRQAKIAEHRLFGGLSVEETAYVLGVSERTVKRDWRLARVYLADKLWPEHDDGRSRRA